MIVKNWRRGHTPGGGKKISVSVGYIHRFHVGAPASWLVGLHVEYVANPRDLGQKQVGCKYNIPGND